MRRWLIALSIGAVSLAGSWVMAVYLYQAETHQIMTAFEQDTRKRAYALEKELIRHRATLRHWRSFYEAAEVMSENGVRRLPICDENDELVGIITADDVDDIILRPKHAHDSAQLSGNGLALGWHGLIGPLLEEGTLVALSPVVERTGQGYLLGSPHEDSAVIAPIVDWFVRECGGRA